MCPGAVVKGGGGGSGGSDGDGGAGGEGNGGGGKGKGGDGSGDGKNGGEGCGDPVCPITGRMFVDILDFAFAGPRPLRWIRHYNSRNSKMSGELGHGWSHDYGYRIRDTKRRITELFDDQNRLQQFPKLSSSGEAKNALGWTLRRLGTGFVLAMDAGIRRVFGPAMPDGFHYLSAEHDANGNTIRLERDARGALTAILDSAGRPYWVEVDDALRIVRITVAENPAHTQAMEVVRYTYDEHGNLASATDAEGYVARYVYDNHLMVEHATVSGLSYFYVYDGREAGAYCVESWGEYPGQIDPALLHPPPPRPAQGRDRRKRKGLYHRRFTYLKASFYSEVEDALGGFHRYFGDANGRVIKDVDAAGGVKEYQFHPEHGSLEATTDVDGSLQQIQLDAEGRQKGVEDASSLTPTSVHYDAEGNEITVYTLQNGEVLRRYDERGNLVFIRHMDETTQEWAYDSRGLCTRWIERGGRVFQYTHDAMGNLVTTLSPGGALEHSEFDYLGRRTAHVDSANCRTEWRWDRRNEIIWKCAPDGSEARIQRDAMRKPTLIDLAGRVTRFAWGGQEMLCRLIHPSGETFEYRYDLEGHLVEVTNPRGQTYRQEVDVAGRYVGWSTFEGMLYRAGYNVIGQTWQEGPNGRAVLEMDAGARLVGVELASGAAVKIEYASYGGATLWDDGTTKIEREYDVMGRMVREKHGAHELFATWSGGRVAELSADTGPLLRYHYDLPGKLAEIQAGNIVLKEETLSPGIVLTELGDHLILRRHLGASGEVGWQGIARRDPSVPKYLAASRSDPNLLFWTHYVFDSGLNIVREERSDGRSYEYDVTASGRVTQKRSFKRMLLTGEERIAYDPAGTPIVEEARFDALMRPIQLGNETFDYDAQGRLAKRMTDAGAWHYTWDDLDNLVEAVGPSHSVKLTYDPRSRLLKKRVVHNGAGTAPARTTTYIWNNDIVLQEVDEASGATRTYLRSNDDWLVRGHVDRDGAGERAVFYLLTPNEGLDCAVDERGKLVWEAESTVYGHRVPTKADVEVRLRFQNQFYDADVGLTYNRMRWYDARIGMYASVDPRFLNGTINPRDYVTNPLREVDPMGLTHPGFGSPNGTPPAGAKKGANYAPSPGSPGGAPVMPGGTTPHPGAQGQNGLDPAYMSNAGHWATPGDSKTPGCVPCPCTCNGKRKCVMHERESSFPQDVKDKIDAAGAKYGCHSCGSKNPDPENPKKKGHFIPDHQPPMSVYNQGKGASPNTPNVMLYPHCKRCASKQGGQMSHHADDIKPNYAANNAVNPPPPPPAPKKKKK
jgi:RHS repeat-associated protein